MPANVGGEDHFSTGSTASQVKPGYHAHIIQQRAGFPSLLRDGVLEYFPNSIGAVERKRPLALGGTILDGRYVRMGECDFPKQIRMIHCNFANPPFGVLPTWFLSLTADWRVRHHPGKSQRLRAETDDPRQNGVATRGKRWP
jgi:hypothetical protein